MIVSTFASSYSALFNRIASTLFQSDHRQRADLQPFNEPFNAPDLSCWNNFHHISHRNVSSLFHVVIQHNFRTQKNYDQRKKWIAFPPNINDHTVYYHYFSYFGNIGHLFTDEIYGK